MMSGAVLCLASVAPHASGDARAVTIDVSASPPLPVRNLLRNPGFEQGGKMPAHWHISSGEPHLFRFRRSPTGGRHGGQVQIDATSTMMSGYVAQVVEVEPERLYRAGVHVRLRGGYALLWLHGYVNGRRFDRRASLVSWGGNPLVPDFVPLEWTRSPDPKRWRWLGREFRTLKGQTRVNMHVGSYFERGSMDVDDAFLGLARTTLGVKVAGRQLAKVIVADEAGKVCWQSGDLTPTTGVVQQRIADLPTDTRYRVVVTTSGGKERARWYPASPPR